MLANRALARAARKSPLLAVHTGILLVAALCLLSACAGPGQVRQASLGAGASASHGSAKNFGFAPNTQASDDNDTDSWDRNFGFE